MRLISLTLPNDGETVDAADVNTPFNTIATVINGNIENANIKSNAAIDGTKIADNSIPTTKMKGGAEGWTGVSSNPSTITYNGNRNYDLVFNSVDLTNTLSSNMKLKLTRTVAAPYRCTDLEASSSQYYSKTSPNKLTFTDDFVVSAWIKLESYPTGTHFTIASRYNGTSGWALDIDSAGSVKARGFNGGSANESSVASYAAVPLNKWVHVAAQLDMSSYSATTTTSYVMIDGVDVSAVVNRIGSNPTSLIQAGNLEIGSKNGASFFDGKIAQVAIFNAKVTQDTMRGYINQGLSGSETSLASAYSFDGVITDLNTTTPNDLTANNSAVATSTDSPFAGASSSGVTEYAYIKSVAYSTNTTVSVVAPELHTIPTSGGISAVYYSTNSTPYGWPSYNFNPYKFSVYRYSALTINGSTKVTWDAEKYDTANNFASGTYTVPVTGFYNLTSRIEITNAGSVQQRMFISLYKNGTEIMRGMDTTAAGTSSIPVTANIACNATLVAGDTIEIYAWTSGGLSLVTGSVNSYFMGHLISQA